MGSITTLVSYDFQKHIEYISEKFIGGETHTPGICNNLTGDESRIHSCLTPTELRPESYCS